MDKKIFDDYTEQVTKTTSIYPSSTDDFGKCYTYLGLLGETVELKRALSKFVTTMHEKDLLQHLTSREEIITAYNDDSDSKYDLLRKFILEFGDILWYIDASILEWKIKSFTLYDIVKEIKEFIKLNLKEQEKYLQTVYDIDLSDVQIFDQSDFIILFANDLKKYYRDNKHISELNIKKLLFFSLHPAPEAIFDIIDVALEANKTKLLSRKERGVLQGSGDNR